MPPCPPLNDIPLSVLIIALAVCLICSAFFSLSETAMMAVNRYRMKTQSRLGVRGARLAEGLLAHTDRLLGVILLGNNLINSASASLAAIITFRLLGENEYALGIGTVAVTFLILVFSEATPKILAAAYPEAVAFKVSYLLKPLTWLFYPAIWFVNLFVHGLLWLMRLKPTHSDNPNLSPEELRILVLESGSFIEKKHHSILVNLFELDNITVDDVMTPRNQIEAINIDLPADELRKQLATCHHTRMPVFRDTPDNVLGFVHVRKVLHTSLEAICSETLLSILREPYFIPAGTPLFTQLQNFQENRRRMGLVVDEYGELQGLVTLEDILEEIIGEFTTQSPTQMRGITPQPDGDYLLEGAMLLRDLNRRLHLNLPTDGPKTLNGLILEYFQDIPEAGTCLRLHGHRLEVVQTVNRSVKVVRLYA